MQIFWKFENLKLDIECLYVFMNQLNNWIWIWMLQISNNVHLLILMSFWNVKIQNNECKWLKLCATKPISYHSNLRFWDISNLIVILLCSMEFQFVILKVLVRVPLKGETFKWFKHRPFHCWEIKCWKSFERMPFEL